MPPTIQALLAARLDQLDPSERGVLERGSVEGKVFHRGAVQALAPDETAARRRLDGARAQGARPPRPAQLAGDDAFRFRHVLIRDAAYKALPKRREPSCTSASPTGSRSTAATRRAREILGYHLEQAHRYRSSWARPTSAPNSLPTGRASGSLTQRSAPTHGATTTPMRACSGGRSHSHRSSLASAPLRPRLARVLFFVSETREATDVVAHLLEQAVSAADRAVELLARRELAIDGFWRGDRGRRGARGDWARGDPALRSGG